MFTKTTEGWGSDGYSPPEWQRAGFRNADARYDIFMLGKTFYVMASGRGPHYLSQEGLPAALFAVIERCCADSPDRRYHTLADLKQSMKAAFDSVLNRVHGPAKAGQLLGTIQERLTSSNNYDPDQVVDFVGQLAMQQEDDKVQMCFAMRQPFFHAMCQGKCVPHLPSLLTAYRLMATEGTYSFEFAEAIAANMRIVFSGTDVPDTSKADALDIAIVAAVRQNRFAAMNTCVAMIRDVTSDALAIRVRDLMLQHGDEWFIYNIEPSTCKNDVVRQAVRDVKQRMDAKIAAIPVDPNDPLGFLVK